MRVPQMTPLLALLLVLVALPAVGAAQESDVVAVPPEGETALAHLDDGTPVWVAHQPDGEVDVLGIGAVPVAPDASPYAAESAFEGVRGATFWVPRERAFLGGSVRFDAEGRATGWFPVQVGGSEDAGPVTVRDLDAYAITPAGEGQVAVGERRAGAARTVDADPDSGGAFGEDEVISPLRGKDAPQPVGVEEALGKPEGRVVLVDGDVVVDGLAPPRVCEVPHVPVPDLPPCPDDAPEPPDVRARRPDPRAYEVQFGPYFARVTGGTLAELIGGSGTASRYAVDERPPGGFDGDPATLERIVGTVPAELAVAVSRERFRDGQAATAVLARDDVAADAMTGAVLTGRGPLLFTGRDALPQATLDELRRVLAPPDVEEGHPGATVYLLGGGAAISPEVERQLTEAGLATTRLAGPTRVETSIAIAGAARTNGPNGAIPEVLLARAGGASPDDPTQAWADAVAAGGWGAFSRVPVLLTPTEGLHPAVARALADFRTTSTVLIGGGAALSDAVADAAPAPRRVAGADRTATAAAIAAELWSVTGSRFVLFDAYAADGWTEALTGAGIAADWTAPLLGGGAPLPAATTRALGEACRWRPVDLLAVGDTPVGQPPAGDDPVDATPAGCQPDAPEGVALDVVVDGRADTPEEDALLTAVLRNGGEGVVEPAEPPALAKIERLPDGQDVFAQVPLPDATGPHETEGSGPLVLFRGERATLLCSSLVPTVPGRAPGTTTAGRYRLALRTSAGIVQADLIVPISGAEPPAASGNAASDGRVTGVAAGLPPDVPAQTGPAAPAGWRPIACAPSAPRTGHGSTWNGREVVLWGGLPLRGPDQQGDDLTAEDYPRQGLAYDPVADRWRRLPPAPLPGRSRPTVAAMGPLVLAVGGEVTELQGGDVVTSYEVRRDAAVYDPASDAWRPAAPFPLDPRTEPLTAWTGDELVLWGGQAPRGPRAEEEPLHDGAAYDPETDRWRSLPVLGFEPSGDTAITWAGERLVLVDSAGRAAAWRPGDDAWERLPDGPASAADAADEGLASPSLVWTGDEVLLWQGGGAGGRLEFDAPAWRPIAESPIPTPLHGQTTVWTGERMLVVGGLVIAPSLYAFHREMAAYDPATDRWEALASPPFIPTTGGGVLTWTGLDLLGWRADTGGFGAGQDAYRPPRLARP